MKRWEYMTAQAADPALLSLDLARLGQQGWELVSVVHHQALASYSMTPHFFVAFLKRTEKAIKSLAEK
jgi:hypothetical protein